MSRAASRSVNRSIIVAVILASIISGSVVFGATYYILELQPAPAQQLVSQPKPALQKFKALGHSDTVERYFLVTNAGKERGIWAKHGLDPEFVTFPYAIFGADLKELVSSGIGIGISSIAEFLVARSLGAPVKVVASYSGEPTPVIFVKADSSISSVKDLDGRRVGVLRLGDHWSPRYVQYANDKFAIKAEPVPLGNLTNYVVALKLGKIDAFISAEGAALRLVDSGELRIVLHFADILPKPYVISVVIATEDLIEQNPDLVRRFVRATLETVKYLKENPGYASDLYSKRTNAPKDLADRVIAQLDWRPSGLGTGQKKQDLVAGVANAWQVEKDIPNLKIEETVDIRFLP